MYFLNNGKYKTINFSVVWATKFLPYLDDIIQLLHCSYCVISKTEFFSQTDYVKKIQMKVSLGELR